MSLFLNINEDFGDIWVWKITNSDAGLVKKLSQTNQNLAQNIRHPLAFLHFVTTRYILEHKGGVSALEKTKTGIPITLQKDEFISITHDDEFSAVAKFSKKVGIDIQKKTPTLYKIKERFINNNDSTFYNNDELTHLTIIWAAKEALFKYLRKEEINFKKCFKITQVKENQLNASFRKNKEHEDISMKFITFDNYILVYTV